MEYDIDVYTYISDVLSLNQEGQDCNENKSTVQHIHLNCYGNNMER